MQTSVVMHFYNEELLIGDWIKHHRHFFDRGILIDHHSADKSREIAESLIPPGWRIVDSELDSFDAVRNDEEVEHWELQLPGWKMALNTTEFLFCPDLKEKLAEWSDAYPGIGAFESTPVRLVDSGNYDINCYPMWRNLTEGFIDWKSTRVIHKAGHGFYETGRHGTALESVRVPNFFHLNFFYAPWPECIPRKLQIQTRIPQSDIAQKRGVHHLVTDDDLDRNYEKFSRMSIDLLTVPEFAETYHRMLKIVGEG